MLKKTQRDLDSREIQKLFKNADESIGSSFFRINLLYEDSDTSQFVVLTPKKFDRSAVVRNRMRRKIYALLRKHFSDWTAGLRVAILVKSPAKDCNYQELEKQILKLMKKIELIKTSD